MNRPQTVAIVACLALVVSTTPSRAQETVPLLIDQLQANTTDIRVAACHELAIQGRESKQAASALVRALRDPEIKVRRAAIGALQEFGPLAIEAVPLVREMLREDISVPRQEALMLLASIGPDAKKALQDIRRLLQFSDDDLTIILAARAHVLIDPANADFAQKAIPKLIAEGLRHENVHVQSHACAILGEIGAPAVKPLMDELDADEPRVRLHAADALGAMESVAEPAVPKLAEKLNDDDVRVRWHAARALGAIGPAAKPAAAALRAALDNKDVRLRVHAMSALGSIQGNDKATITKLAGLITADAKLVRLEAVRALQILDPTGAVSRQAMLKALDDQDPQIQAHAIEALALAGQTGVPGVVEELNDENSRYSAAMVIAELGAQAAAATPVLVKALQQENPPDVERELLIALGEIGPAAESAIPVILPRLQSQSDPVRRSAVFALGRIGPAARATLPAIEKIAEGPDELMKAIVAWATVRIEPSNKAKVTQALPLVTAGLESPSSFVREEMAEALGLARGLASAAVPALLKRLDDSEPRVRHAVLLALAQIGPPEFSVESIAARLNDDAEPVRRSATFALGSIGPAAKSHVPALTANLQGEDNLLRVVSAWALVKIEPTNGNLKTKAMQLLRNAATGDDEVARDAAKRALNNLSP